MTSRSLTRRSVNLKNHTYVFLLIPHAVSINQCTHYQVKQQLLSGNDAAMILSADRVLHVYPVWDASEQ
eukprot:557270-Pyramimonas_sp.AAC.2